jgi:hypothetical protein
MSPEKINGMEVDKMYTVTFKDEYSKKERKIDHNSPEIRFMKSICGPETNAGDFFNETTSYKKQVFLDAPNGHFDGVNGINEFAGKWLADFEATHAEVYPVIQTVANGRAVTEMEVWFYSGSRIINKVPMAVFADLIGRGRMEGMRIYYFFKFLKGAIAYRKPIYRPRFNNWCEPGLLTGSVRYYYEQLHNFRKDEALNNIVDMSSNDILYGGYRPAEEEPLFKGKGELRKVYEGICANCPHKTYVRFETIADDGVNCATEWTIVVTKKGLAEGDVSFAGCAIYERDEEGRLCSIRICDNAGYDMGLDLNSIPASDIYVE